MNFGKQFAKDVNLHPDAVLQMAIQLAYFRLHKRLVALCFHQSGGYLRFFDQSGGSVFFIS